MSEASTTQWGQIAKWVIGVPAVIFAGLMLLGALAGPPDPRGGQAAADACEILVKASGKYPASFRRTGDKAVQYERDKMAVDIYYEGRSVFGDSVQSTATCFFDAWLPSTQPRLTGLQFDNTFAHPDLLDVLNRKVVRGL